MIYALAKICYTIEHVKNMAAMIVNTTSVVISVNRKVHINKVSKYEKVNIGM